MDTTMEKKETRHFAELGGQALAGCQTAEQAVYPFLKPEQNEECRRNVDAFYANVKFQEKTE